MLINPQNKMSQINRYPNDSSSQEENPQVSFFLKNRYAENEKDNEKKIDDDGFVYVVKKQRKKKN